MVLRLWRNETRTFGNKDQITTVENIVKLTFRHSEGLTLEMSVLVSSYDGNLAVFDVPHFRISRIRCPAASDRRWLTS